MAPRTMFLIKWMMQLKRVVSITNKTFLTIVLWSWQTVEPLTLVAANQQHLLVDCTFRNDDILIKHDDVRDTV